LWRAKAQYYEVLMSSAGLVTAAARISAAKIDNATASEKPLTYRLHS